MVLPAAGTTAIYTYRAIYLLGDEEFGQWSQPFEITVRGRGERRNSPNEFTPGTNFLAHCQPALLTRNETQVLSSQTRQAGYIAPKFISSQTGESIASKHYSSRTLACISHTLRESDHSVSGHIRQVLTAQKRPTEDRALAS